MSVQILFVDCCKNSIFPPLRRFTFNFRDFESFPTTVDVLNLIGFTSLGFVNYPNEILRLTLSVKPRTAA